MADAMAQQQKSEVLQGTLDLMILQSLQIEARERSLGTAGNAPPDDPGRFDPAPAETIKVASMYRGQPLGTVNPRPAVLIERLVEKLQQVPGVTGVAAASATPFASRPTQMPILIEGRSKATPNQADTADYMAVTAGFFRLMKIPVVKGRDFRCA